MAPPTPRLKGRRHTSAPARWASAAAASTEPSSTTRTSVVRLVAATCLTTAPTDLSSFHAGTTTRTRGGRASGSDTFHMLCADALGMSFSLILILGPPASYERAPAPLAAPHSR